VLGTYAPTYMYAIPILSMCGSRPAKLSLIHCTKTRIEAAGFVVGVTRNSRQTSPFIRSLTQNAILGARGRQTGTLGFKASQAGYIADLIVTLNPAITRQRQSDRRGEELIDEGRAVFSRLMQRGCDARPHAFQ